MWPPGALSGRKARFFGSWSPSWAPLGTVLGPSWVVLGASWTVLGPSRAVPGQSWGPFGPSSGDLGTSWSVGKPKRRECQKPSKTNGTSTNFASRGSLGSPPGALLGRLGGLLGRLGAILGVLERSWVVLEASWALLSASWGPLGPSWGIMASGARISRIFTCPTPPQEFRARARGVVKGPFSAPPPRADSNNLQ